MLLNIFDTFCKEYANIIFFILNLIVLVLLILSFIFVRDTKKRWNRLNDYLGDVTKTVDSIRFGDLSKKIQSFDLPDSVELTESLNRMIETLHDRELMLHEYHKDLAEQNRILVEILNSLSDGLMIVDENNKILRATEKIALWFNKNGESVVGHSLLDFINIIHKKPIAFLNNDEVEILNNSTASYTASAVELKEQGAKKQYVVILRNTSDQKELETLKEDFVATLTHDLKVPIIAETNMLELFLNESFGQISDKQRLALKNMQTSNKELLDLVQIVLETYKIKDGKMSLYKENIMLKSFINEIIEEMTPLAKKTKNEISFTAQRDIRIFADRFQLKRVIKNLIQNAISYGNPSTPIDITIGEIPEYVTIKVKDYGAGIPKNDIDKIFNKYYSAAKKFRKIGTGLGLYLALQITKAHKGDLTVESVEGEYTEFCIKIPVNYERSFI
ncbi:MAG: hypothetical protein E7Z89_01985 [Cyanobacteria bacterium SIG28]|nr:hypothetical protein [Cyanobacteria bacterium SIG28]